MGRLWTWIWVWGSALSLKPSNVSMTFNDWDAKLHKSPPIMCCTNKLDSARSVVLYFLLTVLVSNAGVLWILVQKEAVAVRSSDWTVLAEVRKHTQAGAAVLN